MQSLFFLESTGIAGGFNFMRPPPCARLPKAMPKRNVGCRAAHSLAGIIAFTAYVSAATPVRTSAFLSPPGALLAKYSSSHEVLSEMRRRPRQLLRGISTGLGSVWPRFTRRRSRYPAVSAAGAPEDMQTESDAERDLVLSVLSGWE